MLLISGIIFKFMNWPASYFLIIFGGLGFAVSLFLSSLTIDFNFIKKDLNQKSIDEFCKEINEEI